MSRFYETRTDDSCDPPQHYVSIDLSSSKRIEIPISKEVFELLVCLQREHWRLERRESRHCVHIEAIPDCYIPHSDYVKSPEDLLIRDAESNEIITALQQLSGKQRRRFLMRHVLGYSVKRIAALENCSKRSIEYSLKLAKDNLRDILADSGLFDVGDTRSQ